MTNAADSLREKIRLGQARLADLERERLVLATQIDAYEEALGIVSEAADQLVEKAQKTARRPSPSWAKTLFPLIKGTGRTFSIDDVIAEAMRHGFNPTRGNVRSQMGAYKAKAWIDAVSDGMFRVTDEGRKQLIPPGQLNERLLWDPYAGSWISNHQAEIVHEHEDEYAS